MDFTLNLQNTPFDMGYTLDSGQAFRWEQRGGWWYGVLHGGVVKTRQDEGAALICKTSSDLLDARFLRGYFRLGDDLESIFSSIMKDEQVTSAVQRFYGLRLLDQDVWECLLSFVIATNANIPRIKGMIATLSQRYGEPTTFEGRPYSLFPTPEALAAASEQDLEACGLGYRARFVKAVAETVSSGRLRVEDLRLMDYERSREILLERVLGKKTLLGIGRKVADCVLLFSCGKDAAFPIDVWMARVLATFYPRLLDGDAVSRLDLHLKKRATLSAAAYERISGTMRGYFGRYAGYAQQYLYHYARTQG